MSHYGCFNPGYLEIFAGPMKSGKTRALINRLDLIGYLRNVPFVVVTSAINTREEGIKSRFGELRVDAIRIDQDHPELLLDSVQDGVRVVAIDEGQFFARGLIQVIDELLLAKTNILVAGLDLDFRGEPFGIMPDLMARANVVNKFAGVCSYRNCNSPATRTQRLIGGKPALYDSPLISIEGANEEDSYEPRCLKHHYVPGKSS